MVYAFIQRKNKYSKTPPLYQQNVFNNLFLNSSVLKAEKVLRHPGLDPLWEALEHETNQQWWSGIAAFVSGIGLFCWGWMSSGLLAIVGIFVVMGGLSILVQIARRPSATTRLRQLILEEPQTVVWVYSVVTERLPFGMRFQRSGLLYFKLVDGDEISVRLPAKRLTLITKILSRALPHALIGYSTHRAQTFAEDPRRLRKQP